MARTFVAASSQYIDLGDVYDATVDFSVGLWVTRNADSARHDLISKEMATADGYVLTILFSGEVAWGVFNGGFPVAQSAATVASGATAHLLGVRDDAAGLLRLFVDGVQDGTDSAGGAPTSSSENLNIGRRPSGGGTNYADATIAEIGIWSAALDASEAAMLAKGISPLLVRPQSLVAYLPLYGRFSGEPDLVGGITGTVTGATTGDHPRIYRPSRSMVAVPASGSVGSGVAASAGVASVSAVGRAIAAAVALSVGVTTVSAAGTSRVASAAASAGQATVAAVGESTRAAAGSGSGVATVAAVGKSIHAAVASVVGSATVIGLSSAASVGASAGVATVSGVGRAIASGVGASVGASAVSGVGAARVASAASAAGVASTTGLSAPRAAAVGAATGAATVTATGRSTAAAVAVSAGVATVTGLSTQAPAYDWIELTDVTLTAATLADVTLSAATLADVYLEPD